jgi:hypothetical protein
VQSAITDAIRNNDSLDGGRLEQLKDPTARQLFFPGMDGLSSFDIDVRLRLRQCIAWTLAGTVVLLCWVHPLPHNECFGKPPTALAGVCGL